MVETLEKTEATRSGDQSTSPTLAASNQASGAEMSKIKSSFTSKLPPEMDNFHLTGDLKSANEGPTMKKTATPAFASTETTPQAGADKTPTVRTQPADTTTAKGTDNPASGSAGATNPTDAAPLRSSPDKVDPTKRNVLVLDDFTNHELGINGPSHGQIIASALQNKGFNVYTAQENAPTGTQSPTNNFAAAFNSISDKIDKGQLPLKSGDVVTASFGDAVDPKNPDKTGDPTFKQASEMLKMNVTPENLKEMKPQILERMGRLAAGNDPETGKPGNIPADVQERAKMAMDSNSAISKLQDRGILVVHAAGNDGPDRFSWGFLTARNDLDSSKPDGTGDNFSAKNSNTTSSDGVFPVYATTPSLLDPRDAAHQNFGQQVSGANFPESGGPAAWPNRVNINRDNFKPESEGNTNVLSAAPSDPTFAMKDFANPSDAALAQPLTPGPNSTKRLFNYGYSADSNQAHRWRPWDKGQPLGPPTDQFSNQPQYALPNVKIENVRQTDGAPRSTEPLPQTNVLAGTSFSVINYMDGKADRNSPL